MSVIVDSVGGMLALVGGVESDGDGMQASGGTAEAQRNSGDNGTPRESGVTDRRFV